MPLLLWGSLAAVLATYVGFPVVTLLRSTVRPRPVRSSAGALPASAAVVVAAHDEAAGIGAKLQSLFDAEPAQGPDGHEVRLDVVVAADGCTDGTQGVVRGFADRGVRLLDLPRVGKAAALNAAVATCDADVLVLTDANGVVAPRALAALLRPFADPEVGGVAGDQRYGSAVTGEVDDGIARGERSYWSVDRWLKATESAGGSAVSATGALYAVRRSLFPEVAAGVTDDFYASTAVVLAGYRLVFCPEAVVHEPVAPSGRSEYRRKVRVMTRGLTGVLLRRELLDPRRHGWYAVQLLGHKVLRRTVVLPLVTLAVSSAVGARRHRASRVLLAGQAAVYGAGLVGLGLGRTGRGCPRLLALPAYFCLVNAAAAHALVNVATGRRIDRWEPDREAGRR
jgi:glycosyltransferase involved in cell wall biosynthesis